MRDERWLEIWTEGPDDRSSRDIIALGKILSDAGIDWTKIWSDYSESEVKQSLVLCIYHLLCGIHLANAMQDSERYEDRVDTRRMEHYLDSLRVRVSDTRRMNEASVTYHPSAHLFISPHDYRIC